MTIKEKIRTYLKRKLNLYDIEDLQIGGHCGCCGRVIPTKILPKEWSWGLCDFCIKGGKNAC